MQPTASLSRAERCVLIAAAVSTLLLFAVELHKYSASEQGKWLSVLQLPSGGPAVELILIVCLLAVPWLAIWYLLRARKKASAIPPAAPRPDEILLNFLTAQSNTLKSFYDGAGKIQNRLLWSPEIPPGVTPEYAKQQKIADDYKEIDKWARMVSIHLRQHLTCADRYFTMPPDGGTPTSRFTCYVGRLLDVIRDVETVRGHTKQRLL